MRHTKDWGKTNCARCGKSIIKNSRNHKYCTECKPYAHVEKYRQDNELVIQSKYAIFLRDEFKCVYCGKTSIEDGVKLVLDHIIPFSKGGDSSTFNLITACEECNMTKGTGDLPEEIYLRIIEKIRIRNGGIGIEGQNKINKILEEYFLLQKKGKYFSSSDNTLNK